MARCKKQNIIVEWQYKCRRCGVIDYSEDQFIADKNWERDYQSAVWIHLRAFEMSFRPLKFQEEIERVTRAIGCYKEQSVPEPVGYHRCDDDGWGVTDLVGATSEQEFCLRHNKANEADVGASG